MPHSNMANDMLPLNLIAVRLFFDSPLGRAGQDRLGSLRPALPVFVRQPMKLRQAIKIWNDRYWHRNVDTIRQAAYRLLRKTVRIPWRKLTVLEE